MIELSEAQIKQAVEEYLAYALNQGKLFYLRLNSGEAYMPAGNGRFYKIQLCPKGTADYFVVQAGQVHLEYLGEQQGPTASVAFVTFIELKKKKGKQSPEQKEFEAMVTGLNCRYAVVRSVEELMEVLARE